MLYLLLGFGQSDLLVPLVLLSILKRLAQTADGLLEVPLLPGDPLHISRSELLILQLKLQFSSLLYEGLNMTGYGNREEKGADGYWIRSDPRWGVLGCSRL